MKPRTCPSQNVDASHKREGTVNGGTKEVETIPKLIGDAAGHGGPAERGGETQRKRHQSMEDLSLQQTTGIELARLLRVRVSRQFLLLPEMQLILPPIESPPTRMYYIYLSRNPQYICNPLSGGRQERLQSRGPAGRRGPLRRRRPRRLARREL